MKKLIRLYFVFALVLSLHSYSDEEEPLDLIYQKLNALEQEIATLRGLVEENTYLIERYQELQQQRYLDLDKRLHDLLSDELEDLDNESLNTSNQSFSEEIDLYKKALELFNASRYSEALEAFRKLIIYFPEGNYSADAYFWSGELYLAQDLLEDARENYLVVTEEFSEHNRAPDSLYKLGVIERILLNEEAATSHFSKLIQEYPDTGAAELAKKSMETSIQESN
ncbi:MAG: tol-pal system protein YbgF [SAR86 cluster bacterium]|nr:tol-pal system protein YbgF [SAR86 cluster bacterium]